MSAESEGACAAVEGKERVSAGGAWPERLVTLGLGG